MFSSICSGVGSIIEVVLTLSPLSVHQVDYDPKTLAALQRTHSKEVVKTAADSEASARMNLSSRSLAPSMRHTWWGGVNEDDAERLWSLSRQQSGAQEGARLTAAD
jgi:hypothetical protein